MGMIAVTPKKMAGNATLVTRMFRGASQRESHPHLGYATPAAFGALVEKTIGPHGVDRR
jgi:hypothetical protein